MHHRALATLFATGLRGKWMCGLCPGRTGSCQGLGRYSAYGSACPLILRRDRSPLGRSGCGLPLSPLYRISSGRKKRGDQGDPSGGQGIQGRGSACQPAAAFWISLKRSDRRGSSTGGDSRNPSAATSESIDQKKPARQLRHLAGLVFPGGCGGVICLFSWDRPAAHGYS